jgi:hypothetical protein
MARTWALLAPVLPALASLACEGGRCVDPPPPGGDLPAIYGPSTRLYPEVGLLRDGSGTLIAPSTVLTAAHVVRYLSTDDPSLLVDYTFAVEGGTLCHPETTQFPVVRVHSFTPPEMADCQTPWSLDVALVRLGRPVPASVAQPRALATLRPGAGDTVTAVGYGSCPGTPQAGREKRMATFTLSRDAQYLCGGDSGGPLLVGGPDGPIAGVHSQTCGAPDWQMVFGDVVGLEAQLEAKVAEWNALHGSE